MVSERKIIELDSCCRVQFPLSSAEWLSHRALLFTQREIFRMLGPSWERSVVDHSADSVIHLHVDFLEYNHPD